ncbi:MAG: folate-binding protein, partial [Caulobacterales bacterium]|nr:folate-binding protein [Caulobacterales bacterium]
AARLALGLPEQDADYGSEDVFPADVNLDLLRGVDFAKGCFVGQEVVSRMKRRGSVRKRTLIARLEAAAAPKGTPLTAGGSTVGELLSSAGAQALALVRLDRLEAAGGPDTVLDAGGASARLRFPDWFPAEARGA